jgi:hypothetical protein
MAYDPLRKIYKGPRTHQEPSVFPKMPTGISVFVDRDTSPTFVPPDAVAPGWGNDDIKENAVLNTNELAWEIGAENGATLFVDNLYWDCGYHGKEGESVDGCDSEQAARMLEFDQRANEPIPGTGAREWVNY